MSSHQHIKLLHKKWHFQLQTVLLRHIKSIVFLFPLVCSAHMNGNCCCRSSLALRVEGDHISPNYVRVFHSHGDCCNKNKWVMHGNNSALGLHHPTVHRMLDLPFWHSVPSTVGTKQAQLLFLSCFTCCNVASSQFASLHPSVMKGTSKRIYCMVALALCTGSTLSLDYNK